MSRLDIIRAIDARTAHLADAASVYQPCTMGELRMILGLAKQALYAERRHNWRKATAERPPPGALEPFDGYAAEAGK